MIYKSSNKFKAKKVKYDGITFDSKKEYMRYVCLKNNPSVKNLKVHQKYTLVDKSEYGRALYYEADFVYNYKGKEIIEDVKSEATITALFKLKKRLFEERYHKEISIYM